ncbi:helix-turn-helix transcriptional regulator [Microbacterium album]|uniref:HTH luxR-type domain-containing protein n=1 Tax=Microbacterium album TaxID=2053191 RepID=A0A917IEH7_9MICO|nr:LuxR C-terminal-related transcriptional regulator [Microbacterium album]GGH40863.1 hypothetical protein GCM10010921_13090 [Microbacterium album]
MYSIPPSGAVGAPRLPPGVVPRPRLLSRLDEGAPLCVVRSAGGSGKTTLLSQWAAGSEHPATAALVWVSRDGGTQSRSGYWLRVLAQLHAGALIDDATLYREMASIADGPAAIPGALRRIVNGLGRELVLLLDNVGSPEPGDFWAEVCDDIVALVRDSPTTRCIVAGRFPTLLEAPSVHATVETTVLGDAEMALDDDEIGAIARRAAEGIDSAAEDALRRHGSSRHAMSLRYTLDLLRRSPGTLGRLAEGDIDAALRDVVRHDLLSRVRDPAALDFIGATAQSPAVDVELAQRLSGRDDAERLLNDLERAGAGHWTTVEGGAQVFSYSDHLRQAAAEDYAERHPQRVAELRPTIARWLWEVRGDGLAAFENAIATGDLDYATHVLLRAHPLSREDDLRVSALLRTLPASQIHRHPLLALRYALMLNTRAETQRKAAEFFVSAATMGRLRSSSTPPQERAIHLAIESAVWRLLGQERRMRDTAGRALEVLEQLVDEERDNGLDGIMLEALSQCGMSLFYAGEYDRALEARRAHARMAETLGQQHLRNIAFANIALIHALRGRLHTAREALTQIRPEHTPEAWRDGYPMAPEHIARAWLHLSNGQPEEARAALRRLDPHFDSIEHWELIINPLTLAEAFLGRGGEAMYRLERVLHERIGRRTLPSVRDRALVGQGIAKLVSGTLRGSTRPRMREKGQGLDAVLGAIAAAYDRDGERAVTFLAEAERNARSPLQSMCAAAAGIIAARRAAAGLDLVGYGVRLSVIVGEEGLRWPLVLLPAGDREALLHALEDTGRSDAADRLRASFALVPALVPDEGGASVPQLTPREREVLLALVSTDSRAEIAERLFISLNTVKSQLRSVYAKLGASNREEALARALSFGLIGADDDEPGREG